jgi:hypothetical protein
MTISEFKRKAKAARRTGSAAMPEGATLIYHGNGEWAVWDRYGQTVETAWSVEKLYYLFE